MADPVPGLTYCGNVHAAADLDAWLATLARFAAPVAATCGETGPFPLGVWWPAPLAGRLAAEPAARARVRAELDALGLRIATLNVFPHGDFHGERVKERVYRPDWATEARVLYTLDAARAAAALVEPGTVLPLSTLPLGFGGGDLVAMRANLARVAAALAAIEAATGVCCVLALEPEPACLVETAAEALACVQVVRREHPGKAVERHLGVCLDLCHLAVMGEDPLAAMAQLAAAEVPVAKIQVSACLEARGAGGLARLLAWDEPRYLHQTVGILPGGGRVRALDLDEVRRRQAEFAAAPLVRTHFHVPVFWDEDGELGSTRKSLTETLRAMATLRLPLLEVETYTWHVLPGFSGRDEDLVAGLSREVGFVRAQIGPTPPVRQP